MSRLTRDSQTEPVRTQNELNRLKLQLRRLRFTAGGGVSPAVNLSPIRHIVRVMDLITGNEPGGLTQDKFTVFLDYDDGTAIAVATEALLFEEVAPAGSYRFSFVPDDRNRMYRMRIECRPDGVTQASVTPSEFQDIT